MNYYAGFCGGVSFQISRAGAQLQVKLCLALPETAKPFPKAAASFRGPPSSTGVPAARHPHQQPAWSGFLWTLAILIAEVCALFPLCLKKGVGVEKG